MITLAHAAEITAAKLATLEPSFRAKSAAWLQEMTEMGFKPYIYCGYRSLDEQAALYAKGPTVTKAAPGTSYHNYGVAFDWVPLQVSAKDESLYSAAWEGKLAKAAYAAGRTVAKRHGLDWLSWETPHLQDARFPSWRQAREFSREHPCPALAVPAKA